MIQLIYASAASEAFTPAALSALLTRARARNQLLQVSGMLLYDAGSFLQVLEGPEEHIAIIYRSIERDPRHRDLRLLRREQIDRREFEDWSMGFADMAKELSRPKGYVDYYRELPKLAQAGTQARLFLRFFAEGLYRQAR